MDAPPQAFDFSGFGSVADQNLGHDVKIMRLDGTDSGMVIKVAGPDSDRRKRFARSTVNARLKAGRPLAITAESAEEDAMAELVAATISWSFPEGFDGPECTPANVRNVYETHGYIRRQVMSAADNLVNFTGASPKP